MVMRLDHMMPSGGQASNGAASVQNTLPGMNAAVMQDATSPDRLDTVLISETGQNLFEMEKIIANLRKYADWANFDINFALDDKTGTLVIRIVDRDTGEVRRQIPPDEILALRSHLQELLKDAFAESA